MNELKARMRREVVKFAYLKKSGEVRIAYGTMMPALVGDHINGRAFVAMLARYAPILMWSVENFDASNYNRW